MGTQNVIVNPLPSGGGYAPGTVVEFCVMYNNWNLSPFPPFNFNWLEGFDITIGSGWIANSITPTTFPQNNSGVGQWIWNPNTFNGNPISAGGAANQFGPGFFYDYDNNGQTVEDNDWGDQGAGPWNFCFEVTVGNTVGSSLSLQVSPVSDGFAGGYTQPGCNGFDQFDLSPGTFVLGCLTPPIISVNNVIDATCSGFNDGTIDVNVNQGSPPYTFYLDGVPTIFPVNNLSTGNYVITCTDNDNCNSNVLNVNVGENTPVITNIVSLTDNICFGQNNGSFELSSIGGLLPITYTLNGNSNQTGIFNNLPSGLYNVIINDDNGCVYNLPVNIGEPTEISLNSTIITNIDCFNDSDGEIFVEVQGGTPLYTYTLNGVTNNTGIFIDLQPGVYNIEVQDNNLCAFLIENIEITQPNLPLSGELIVTEPTCNGYSDGSIMTDINGGTPPYTYLWDTPVPNNNQNLNNIFSGNYEVLVSDDNGCEITLNTTVNQPLVVTLTGENFLEVCLGDSIFLESEQNNGISPYLITWVSLVNGENFDNSTFIYPSESGIYRSTIIDANGCQAQHNLAVIVNPLPDPSFIEDKNTGCNPTCVQFEVLNPNNLNQYLWDFGDLTNGNGLEIEKCYQDSGFYTVKLISTSNKGCINSLIKESHIRINKTPTSNFISVDGYERDILNPNFEFVNTSLNSQSYLWYLGDWSFSSDIDISHTYLGPDKYCVELIAYNYFPVGINVCSDTIVKCVDVLPVTTLFVPNTFTPNGDGKNENFKVKTEMVKDFYIIIANRWGQVLYRSYDFESFWDGTYNGKMSPEGVYYYDILYSDIKSRIYNKKGTITLLK